MNPDSPPVTTSLGFDIGNNASKRRKNPDGPPAVHRYSARILVVDNDPALRRLLSIRLGAANYEVESVDGAHAALDACTRLRPNLVITDLRMEPMDGLGLLKSGSLVKAVVVVDEVYEGWALTDEILRMATKTAPVSETIPTRLFTKDNIGSIQVTTAAQASGAWFGDNSFEGEFAKLWGVS